MFKPLILAVLATFALMGQDTVVVLIHHAEKGARSSNAHLSSRGLRRAGDLVDELAAFKPAAIFATEVWRTQQTVAPLADRLGLKAEIRARGEEAAVGQEVLENWKGRTVVICGHSDTLATLAGALGFRGFFPEVRAYDRLWVLTVPGGPGPVTLEERTQKSVARPWSRGL
ncbi:histidine phosphatase family protein [Geothrix sp. 21YS21S-2]|uniref:histidine phosphatase family protein n=1 Tax=Geothrix sp. 21YS21S-2 TaxID=3068893 RepID=UPI0027B88A2B|nr:histidine phosphatase family protein [Geothrix sp. 21YS21S-2]